MCGDCWNAAMGAPAAFVAGRFAWVGYKDRIPFVGGRRGAGASGADAPAVTHDPSPVDAAAAPVDPASAPVAPDGTATAGTEPSGSVLARSR